MVIRCVFLFLWAQIAWAGNCVDSLGRLSPVKARNFSEIYTELQTVNSKGKTRLALQSDFDPFIDPEGGGACASTTAFNILQGLRLKTGQSEMRPNKVLKKAFTAMPELLAGRVTNKQMIQLMDYFGKYFPKHRLDVAFERAPQSQAVGGDPLGPVWSEFQEKQLETTDNEIKMVVYQVHDDQGELLGRHFVVLKRKLEGNKAAVIDPSKPSKEFFYEFIEEAAGPGKPPLTKLVRPDRVPHSLGWDFTLDTIFSIKLRAENLP